ncbi:MAG TPA: hypothetical protein VM468_15220 [Mycoplana sp.]|nr:hypothetical protein [Mycoplana sp.]
MAVSMMELKVNAIRRDVGLSRSEKVERLERLRNASQALRRAAHACAAVHENGWYEDVHIVERELANLGGDALQRGTTAS